MKKIIWIIDDDHSILEVIKMIVEQKYPEYSVITISDPSSITSKLRSSKPHLIFMDIEMAGVNGLEIGKKLKSQSATKKIPVIMMSAGIHLDEKAKKIHANGILKKPFAIEELTRTVNRYL